MPRLHVIIASTRPGRVGRRVGDWFVQQAQAEGSFEVSVTDLAELGLPFLDEPHHPSSRRYTKQHTKKWSEIIDAADAFVFVMPEYNFGFSAPLKNAIDFLYHEWEFKSVGFVSYGGVSGGMRAVQMIKPVLTGLRMFPVTDAVSIQFVGKRFDGEGRFQPDDAMAEASQKMLGELARISSALATLRPQQSHTAA